MAVPEPSLDYDTAAQYWDGVAPTVDGMLGGFGKISKADIAGSDALLRWVFDRPDPPRHGRCLDCGAGIGRVSRLLLQRHFGKVDMVEQNQAFCDKAKEQFSDNPKLGSVFCSGLQDFAPPPPHPRWDVVWVQWVIIYLPDAELIAFLQRMAGRLSQRGVLVLKDNFTMGSPEDPDMFVKDEEDSSVTRPLEHVKNLAKEAGLVLLKSSRQENFPKQLFKVYMLVFKPQVYDTESCSQEES